jgi:hypothetical protein
LNFQTHSELSYISGTVKACQMSSCDVNYIIITAALGMPAPHDTVDTQHFGSKAGASMLLSGCLKRRGVDGFDAG